MAATVILMVLKARVAKLEDVPEQFRSEYTSTDDGKAFVLAVEAVDGLSLSNVEVLSASLGKERKDRETLAKQLKAFEGLDPGHARESVEKVKQMATWTPEDKVREQLKAVETQLAEKFGKETAAEKAAREKLEKQLKRVLVTQAATAAISKQGASVKGLLPHAEASIETFVNADGEIDTRVIDAHGNPRMSMRSGVNGPMPIEEFVETLRHDKDLAPLFPSSGLAGGGSGGGGPQRGAPNSKVVSGSDLDALSNNIEDIASGKVTVT